MKIQLALALSGVAAGGLYAGGAFSTGEVYDLPVKEVRAELSAMDLADDVLIGAGGSGSAPVKVRSGDDWVHWRLSSLDGSTLVFTAKFRPEGPSKTRVWLQHELKGSSSSIASRLTSTRFMRSYAETSFEEQVDARLEGRSFNREQALHQFGLRAANDPEQVRELGLAVQGMFNEVANQAAANAHVTGTPSASEPQAAMRAATRPSVQLQSNN